MTSTAGRKAQTSSRAGRGRKADHQSIAPTTARRRLKPLTAQHAARLDVADGEEAWTREEMAEVRGVLVEERDRLASDLARAAAQLALTARESGEGNGDDPADVGSMTFEREHGMTLARQTQVMLDQVCHALDRIEVGTYGTCESCEGPIGKMRLMAFPRATMCLTCKRSQEGRASHR